LSPVWACEQHEGCCMAIRWQVEASASAACLVARVPPLFVGGVREA